jgi:ABC-type glucose/galactose transport system permease subunit
MAYLDSPEVKRLLETGGMEQLAGGISLKDMKNIAEAFQDLSAVAIAANILDFSIFSGLIISLPTALLAMRRPKL